MNEHSEKLNEYSFFFLVDLVFYGDVIKCKYIQNEKKEEAAAA